MWTKDWLLKRNVLSHTNLLEEIRAFPEDYRNFMRMDEETYLHLLSLVTPLIAKQTTKFRPAVCAHERLTATLRFLSTGRSYQDLRFSSCLSQPSLSKIIPETCDAIFDVLAKEYLKLRSHVYIFPLQECRARVVLNVAVRCILQIQWWI